MTKGVVIHPILTKELSSRRQVDLIDMQCMPSGSNKKWIMVYQDHLTKFSIHQALASKRAAEVAFHLLDILLLFGAPVILQSDNGSEFTSQVITELKEVWPKLTLVHGKHRHPQSQVSVEHANGDIKDMLVLGVGLTTSSLPMEVIARMETEEDLLAVTPIRPDSENDNSLSQTDGVASQIQATSDETPTHDLTEDVLLPVEHGNTTTQYTGDNVTSQQ
ncbi:KRAB-A domain-containing protein 2-like [Palaemon carinicauda]|uniref:KRAB-A domain-containing protein 2-like n=1 Tax=Palaemon carinicauda TaxID=392227 RepID=UPI0035B6504D